MSVRRSNEDLASALRGDETFCNICHQPLNQTDRTAVTPCRHPFHLRCITEHLRTSRICPICRQTCTLESELLANDNLQAEQLATGYTQNDTTPNNEPNANQQPTRGRNSSIRGKNPGRRRGMVTRSQRQLNSSSRVNNSSASTVNNDNLNNTRMNIDDINKAIQTAMQVQQQQMLENLTAYIQTQLSSLSLGHHITSNVRETRNDLPSQLPRTVPIHNTISSNPNSNNSRHSHISTRSNTQVQPEKVPNIIQSWRIKFDGVKDGLHAEEFLYRVKSLAQQNLNGDYQLLCDHLHLFFAGKANEWYWQYHRSCNYHTWDDFCKEFIQKFRDIDSDMDIWESINSRHQGDKESFEEYQFHVEKLVARLKNKISEESLVHLLIRHAKSSVRYELMHLNIKTLSRLREEIRTHDQYCKQLKTHAGKGSANSRPFISQIEQDSEESTTKEVLAVQYKPLKCWNCDKIGHRFEDCFEARSIFCFGCGAKNTYKPKCKTCNPSGNRLADASA